jgi:hypothetical protein
MYRLDTQIDIEASAERIWSVLIDFAGYARWNPFIRSVAGSPTVGASLNVFIQPPGSRGMRFRPKVLAVEPRREFRWKGRLLLPGLFDGEHFFVLEPKSETRVGFHQGEIFTGALVALFRRSVDGPVREGFLAMNDAIKREAEAG